MIKTRTGSQEVHQFWQTEAIFQNKKIHKLFPLTFAFSLNFISNKSACDFGPSSEPRKINSSFFGVLITGQSFWNDAKIVDRRFSMMSSRKNRKSWGFLVPAIFPLQQFF